MSGYRGEGKWRDVDRGCSGPVEHDGDTGHEDCRPQCYKVYWKYIKTVCLAHIQKDKKGNHMC